MDPWTDIFLLDLYFKMNEHCMLKINFIFMLLVLLLIVGLKYDRALFQSFHSWTLLLVAGGTKRL